MVEHIVCLGCKWNEYPICKGTIMFNGEFMNIENLKPVFNCGVKDRDTINDLSDSKTELELLKERVSELEK